MNEPLDPSLRRFFRRTGATLRQAMEKTARNAGGAGKHFVVKAVMAIEGLSLARAATGTIDGRQQSAGATRDTGPDVFGRIADPAAGTDVIAGGAGADRLFMPDVSLDLVPAFGTGFTVRSGLPGFG